MTRRKQTAQEKANGAHNLELMRYMDSLLGWDVTKKIFVHRLVHGLGPCQNEGCPGFEAAGYIDR